MPWKSEFVCHKSRFVHQILCESPFTSRDSYAMRPLILWHILGAYFLLIWGGGQKVFFMYLAWDRATSNKYTQVGCIFSLLCFPQNLLISLDKVGKQFCFICTLPKLTQMFSTTRSKGTYLHDISMVRNRLGLGQVMPCIAEMLFVPLSQEFARSKRNRFQISDFEN